MKLKFRKIASLCVITLTVLAASVPAKASTLINEPELITIQSYEMPPNVVPFVVSSEEEAQRIMENDMDVLSAPNTINEGIALLTTGDALVDYRDLGLGSLQLRLSYGTSGPASTGRITFHDPYVQHSGFTFGCVWNQTNIGSYIKNSKKDVYAYANGTMDYYFLINGFLKLGSSPGNLSGTAFLVR